MKTILQRVSFAKVEVDGKIIGEIQNGLLILVAFKETDTEKELEWLVKKILQLRIFNDVNEKLNLSITDVKGDLLVVSQFTLYADCRKGNRPSFSESARPEIAEPLYNKFIEMLRKEFNGKVECGEFGAHMKVSLMNDGPVTITLKKEKEDPNE